MRLTNRKPLVGVALAAVVAVFFLLRFATDEVPANQSPSSVVPTAQALPAVSAPRPPAPPETASVASEGVAAKDAAISERAALVESDPVLMDRALQHTLAPAADARWADAVDRAGYTRDDIDPAVRESLRLVEFEPRYAEAGMIEGLTIRSLPSGHPFEQAGFREGDLLSRIEGVLLSDPSELPALFTRLGPRFEVCARDDDEGESCSMVAVE